LYSLLQIRFSGIGILAMQPSYLIEALHAATGAKETKRVAVKH
jgi:hypothetical protein